MTKKSEKLPTLDELVKATDMPKVTRLGRKAMGKLPKSRKLRLPKDKKENDEGAVIERLKALKVELDKPRRHKKSKDVLARTPKEIIERAASELCYFYARNTGYDARWIRDGIYDHWESGRKTKHDYEKRIRVCQLLHWLVTQEKMSMRQAQGIVGRVYEINRTDITDSYFEFKKNLEVYYFPEIKLRGNISMYIFIDILKYGRISVIRESSKSQNLAVLKYEGMIEIAAAKLQHEIRFAKKNKLEKWGVAISPALKNFAKQGITNFQEITQQFRKTSPEIRQFTFSAFIFLNDLEFYWEIESPSF